MQQKVVIRVRMGDAKKRSKAMKVVVGVQGVLSTAIEGADNNQIVVIGDGVDSVVLTTLLRKTMGYAELVSVAAVDEEEEEENAPGSTVQPMVVSPFNGGYTPQYYYVVNDHYQYPSCCIL